MIWPLLIELYLWVALWLYVEVWSWIEVRVQLKIQVLTRSCPPSHIPSHAQLPIPVQLQVQVRSGLCREKVNQREILE